MDPSVTSFWMHQCQDEDDIDDFVSSVAFPKREKSTFGRIFVAVNDNMSTTSAWQTSSKTNGNHWSLLVINVEHHDVQYWHFDSVRHSGNWEAAKDIAKKFSQYVYPQNTPQHNSQSAVQVIQARTPQQLNGYDCGVHVLGAAKAFANMTSDSDNDDSSSCNSVEILENELQKVVGHDTSAFCVKLREEIASEIHRLKTAETSCTE
mmetsp:Transcript_22685/g.42188  ORF Transcript_22685/g.42188 Transcript_22685/m.42188 type:complete len:206 (-) Transcript_22685:859-1476(-)